MGETCCKFTNISPAEHTELIVQKESSFLYEKEKALSEKNDEESRIHVNRTQLHTHHQVHPMKAGLLPDRPVEEPLSIVEENADVESRMTKHKSNLLTLSTRDRLASRGQSIHSDKSLLPKTDLQLSEASKPSPEWQAAFHPNEAAVKKVSLLCSSHPVRYPPGLDPATFSSVECEANGRMLDYFGQVDASGRPQGFGVALDEPLNRFVVCSFDAGQACGAGQIYQDHTSYFEGKIDGWLPAFGRLFQNNEIYEGGFLHGEKHGAGAVVYADGTKTAATWDRGRLAGKVTITGTDGKLLTMFV